MKDLVNRAISLGLGVVVESKEQIEKVVDDLVKKGEMSRAESSSVVNELVAKGEELKGKIESIVRDRMQAIAGERGWATREEINHLEARVKKLEALLQEKQQD